MLLLNLCSHSGMNYCGSLLGQAGQQWQTSVSLVLSCADIFRLICLEVSRINPKRQIFYPSRSPLYPFCTFLSVPRPSTSSDLTSPWCGGNATPHPPPPAPPPRAPTGCWFPQAAALLGPSRVSTQQDRKRFSRISLG